MELHPLAGFIKIGYHKKSAWWRISCGFVLHSNKVVPKYGNCRMPVFSKIFFVIILSMQIADPETPLPTYGIQSKSNIHCNRPSSPWAPWIREKITSGCTSSASTWATIFLQTLTDWCRNSISSGPVYPPASWTRVDSDCGPVTHSPERRIPKHETSYLSDLSQLKTHSAESRETRCSKLRPPKITKTLIFVINNLS